MAMRPVPLLLALALMGLAGCLSAETPAPEAPAAAPDLLAAEVPAALRAEDGSVRLVELYDGTIVGANAAVLMVSPDQLGMVDRQFYVHNGTRNITLQLEADDELLMYVLDPDCHDLDCAQAVETESGSATHVVDAPKAGGWEVVFFKRDAGVAEVAYALHVTKSQDFLHGVEKEVHAGDVVAAHLGAIRISPDQLGDVYREFWVHEGVQNLTVSVTVSEDIEFVLGQSDAGRDNDSEESWVTAGGSLDLQFDAPQTGGWYMIFFHHPDGPGVAEVDYTVLVDKQR